MNKLTDPHRLIWRKKPLTVMFIFVFLITGNFNGFAGDYVQNEKLSVKMQQATFDEIVSAIENQSDYVFFYKSSDVDRNIHYDVDLENRNIHEILDQLMENSSLSYRISGKYIFIDKKEIRKDNELVTKESSVLQQRKQITGTVTDEQGEPVIGANIIENGTNNGTVSDIDGRFSLLVENENATLRISYIGYIEQEINITGRNSLNVVLQEDTQALDELVVVGYGVIRKSDVTGSISTAKGSDIIKSQSFNALEGLKGKAAGVNIFSNTGQPGGEMRVIIRGIATINASASPLYVVDGVVMSNFQFLNPNDIESIEVLKDASSAAIYGARGANGVVLVTTKRGGNTGNQARISYDGSVSLSTMARYMDVMNSSEWMATFKQGLENANTWQGRNFTTDLSQIFTDPRLFNSDGSPKYDTDWQRESSRMALSHNHQLNIQRGDGTSSMGAFLNYTDQQGILHNTYMKRLNAKLAYDDKPTKWLSTGVNLLVNHTWANRTSDNPYGQGALRTMVELSPFIPVMLDGVYMQSNDVQTSSILRDQNNPNSGSQGFSPEGVGNPVELLKRLEAMQYRTQIFGNTALTFHLNKDLELKTQFGVDYHNNRNANYTPFTPRPLINQSANDGAASANNSNTFYWQEETYLTYNKEIGKHYINALAGVSWQERTYTYFSASDKIYSDDFYGYYNMGSGTERPSVSNDHDRWAMNSYFLRGVYSYDSKYMATLTSRWDGSSKFGANNKYSWFPSIGLGWMMSSEDFLIDNPVISRLKPHTSFGVTGNSEIGTYASLATIGQSTTIIGESLQTVSYRSRMPNPDLKWERTNQWDVGIDLGLFNNRINVEASYYYKYTTDLLLGRPLPRSTGFSSITSNIGEVSNRGIDLLINAYPIDNQNFQWNTTFNLSFNKNRVEKLDESSSVDPLTGKRQILLDGFVGYDMLIREGEELSTFYGYKRAGIYDGNPANWNTETMNVPSTIGEKVTYKEREILGNGLPDWMGSLINTFNYRGFDLTVDLQFSLGADIMQEYFHSAEGRFLTSGLDRLWQEAWHPTLNPNGSAQAIRLANFGMGNNANADDTWVADGSYLRGNLIQLGYTFSSSAVQNMGLSALRFYANVNNAFLVTSSDYLGYDPDNSSRLGDNKWGTNRQFFTYPRARTFTFGINLTF
ncbi:SusC/RagA family TonB-linked outer membrane protein [Proteiniphilum saccharofermentans]|uniref:SusC/RagA family TonB-linked outer membrane protein n=1 Tax=Proteiniphilum saccharofermentans TaxID=1642647 RepID=UPI0028A997C2|nr:SusC/RagA family TonB-linked outer membrane protein [Proteiniphilum saccharofermentans]